jgi:cyclic-di-AMP phosphodiesterase PgpH
MIRIGTRRGRNPAFSPNTDAESAAAKNKWAARVALVLAFVALTASLTKMPKRSTFQEADIDLQKVAEQEIEAEFYFKTIDERASLQARNAAAEGISNHYRIDRNVLQQQKSILQESFARLDVHREALRKHLLDALRASNDQEETDVVVQRSVAAFVLGLKQGAEGDPLPDADTLVLWLSPSRASLPHRVFAEPDPALPEAPRTVTALNPETVPPLRFDFAATLAELGESSLEFVLNQGVRDANLSRNRENETIVLVQGSLLEAEASGGERRMADVPDPQKAVEKLNERLLETAKIAAKNTEKPDEWAKLHDAALALARPFVRASIRFDQDYTADARQRAREAAPEEMKEIAARQVIQRSGDLWTPQSRSDAKTYFRLVQQRPGQRVVASLISHAILVALVLICLYRVIQLISEPKGKGETHLYLSLLLICGVVVTGRVVSYFEPSGYVMPMAVVGILCAILADGRLAAMVSLLTAVLISAQFNYDWRLLVLSGAMSMAGVLTIFQVRRRSDMTVASVTAVVVGLVATVALSLGLDSMQGQSSLWRFIFNEGLHERLILIVLNGMLLLMMVPALLSPLERLFGITTDIQLLEYSDLNNELLSQLARKAGATYSHSQIVGQLAAAAADAIGANPLMAKVCAFYHDIGKMRRSEYFSENQTGYNIHDELSPRLSARAIASHVTQGAQMAREYHLPKPIVDGILEHHGTCLIGYFYQQAKEQQKHDDAREEDFRYPGPRPTRPETAILMICDAVESGVRSLRNPNEERVREFVDKIIAGRAADRQFDNCNLTLKQLDTIAEVVTKQILTNLHTRVAYPNMTDKEEHVDNVVALPGKS